MRSPTTFEAARRRYQATVERLALAGLGRRTISRVEESAAFWSPTADVLEEAMRLGFVEREQLPSAKRYLDAHRSREYRLTELGRAASELAGRRMSEFVDQLADAVIDNHPYFRHLLEVLEAEPLVCHVITEGDLARAARDGRGASWWAEHAAALIRSAHPLTVGDVPVVMVSEQLRDVLRGRFGTDRMEPPSRKKVADAMNDAFANAALAARGLPIGATNLRSLRRWGVELRLLDASRHVPAIDGFVTWAAADLDISDAGVRARRRTLAHEEGTVAAALVKAYRQQAAMQQQRGDSLDAPYLPIYAVRAQAAYETRVTRALVDLVLERLVDGLDREYGVQFRLHLTGEHVPPRSEPVYSRGGKPRYQMTMIPRTKVTT